MAWLVRGGSGRGHVPWQYVECIVFMVVPLAGRLQGAGNVLTGPDDQPDQVLTGTRNVPSRDSSHESAAPADEWRAGPGVPVSRVENRATRRAGGGCRALADAANRHAAATSFTVSIVDGGSKAAC